MTQLILMLTSCLLSGNNEVCLLLTLQHTLTGPGSKLLKSQ